MKRRLDRILERASWVRELKRINGHAAEVAGAAMSRVHQPEGLHRRASD